VAQIVDADVGDFGLHAHPFPEPLEVNHRLARHIAGEQEAAARPASGWGARCSTAWRPSGTGCASRRPARRASAALSLVGVEGAAMAQIIPDGALPVTALIAEAQRELDLRRQFYWTRVRAGKMRQDDADKRIALMAAIVKRLTA